MLSESAAPHGGEAFHVGATRVAAALKREFGYDGILVKSVPGGVVLASATIAESALGFTPERYALVIATYMALDGMGTACNLTGDGAIALIVDRFAGRKAKEPQSSR